MTPNESDDAVIRCPKCKRSRAELDDAGVAWDFKLFRACEECDPDGESER